MNNNMAVNSFGFISILQLNQVEIHFQGLQEQENLIVYLTQSDCSLVVSISQKHQQFYFEFQVRAMEFQEREMLRLK